MRELEIWSLDLSAGGAPLCAVGAHLGMPLPPEPASRSSASPDASPVTSLVAAASVRRAAHVALRLLLARDVGLATARSVFTAGAAGKPELPSGPPFSLSHAGERALIALGGASAVGIDIEAARALRISPARQSALEAAAVALADGRRLPGNDDGARLLAAWVRLEAVAKATGDGIGALLEDFRAHGPAGEAARAARCAASRVADLAAGRGYVAAVAVAARPGAPELTVPPIGAFPVAGDDLDRWVAALQP